jgi:mannose-6-phosphate isomerase-like protein (cupin superfamily)
MKALLIAACLMAAQPAFAQTQAPAAGRGARGGGAQAAQATPAAPGPGSPAIYKSAAEFLAAIKASEGRGGDSGMVSSNFSNTDQWRINLVKRDRGATPLTHAGNTELHYIVEGSATLVTGGKIIRPAGGGAADVEGGVTRKVGKGDVVLVPADTVHWYKDVEGSITYLEVRFVVPTK